MLAQHRAGCSGSGQPRGRGWRRSQTGRMPPVRVVRGRWRRAARRAVGGAPSRCRTPAGWVPPRNRRRRAAGERDDRPSAGAGSVAAGAARRPPTARRRWRRRWWGAAARGAVRAWTRRGAAAPGSASHSSFTVPSAGRLTRQSGHRPPRPHIARVSSRSRRIASSPAPRTRHRGQAGRRGSPRAPPRRKPDDANTQDGSDADLPVTVLSPFRVQGRTSAFKEQSLRFPRPYDALSRRPASDAPTARGPATGASGSCPWTSWGSRRRRPCEAP